MSARMPVEALEYYDPPSGPGDEGWDYDSLRESVARCGILQPLEVGRIAGSRDSQWYVFNGNHRLKVARELGLADVPVVPSRSEHASEVST